MSKTRKRFLLRYGLVTGLIWLIATPSIAKPLLTDEMGPCTCIFLILVAGILILQVIPAAILFLCLLGVILVLLFKMHKTKNTITQSPSGPER